MNFEFNSANKNIQDHVMNDFIPSNSTTLQNSALNTDISRQANVKTFIHSCVFTFQKGSKLAGRLVILDLRHYKMGPLIWNTYVPQNEP